MALLRRGQPPAFSFFGAADLSNRLPVTANTLFEAASLSKPLFAFAVLEAAAEGAVALDQPVTGYFPLPYHHMQDARIDDVADPRLSQITPRMLLAHTAGFPNWSLDAPLPVQFAPGSRWQYSSEGYVYLQRALEQRWHQPLESFMQRRALGPLGMTQSSYEASKATLARGYDEHARPVDSVLGPQSNGEPSIYVHPLASTTLRTTAADYARFVQHVLDAADDDPAVELLLTPQIAADATRGISWGLGFGLSREGRDIYFFHSGSSPGARSLVVGSRTRGEALVMLSNGDGGRDAELAIVRARWGPLALADFIAAPH